MGKENKGQSAKGKESLREKLARLQKGRRIKLNKKWVVEVPPEGFFEEYNGDYLR